MDLGVACVKQAPRFRLKPGLQYVRWLDGGTEGKHGFGSCVREVSSQIPAKAGTTIRALACLWNGG
jgi:hypothetical protein